ncbi:MAG: hypothetical protein K2N35_13530 [Muribaculaceae bacterium]|nr:hypothetical protein [Muribaculaceae bacterium]
MNTCDVDLCLKIATEAHRGQKDLDGNSVILHPLTVGLMGKTTDEQCVGFLHDVVEDTEYTFDDLLAMGVPIHIVVSRSAGIFPTMPMSVHYSCCPAAIGFRATLWTIIEALAALLL